MWYQVKKETITCMLAFILKLWMIHASVIEVTILIKTLFNSEQLSSSMCEEDVDLKTCSMIKSLSLLGFLDSLNSNDFILKCYNDDPIARSNTNYLFWGFIWYSQLIKVLFVIWIWHSSCLLLLWSWSIKYILFN
jgi:hypothetical protein